MKLKPPCVIPLTNPCVLITRSEEHVHITGDDTHGRRDLTPDEARTYAYALLASADDLPLSAIPTPHGTRPAG
jgi:hypothetical protein